VKFFIKFVYVVALLFAIGGMLAMISAISGGGGDNVMQQTGAIAFVSRGQSRSCFHDCGNQKIVSRS